MKEDLSLREALSLRQALLPSFFCVWVAVAVVELAVVLVLPAEAGEGLG